MDAREIDIKGIISMTRTEYSLLKEILKFHECGWSYEILVGAAAPTTPNVAPPLNVSCPHLIGK
jgi:hypothetical protein